ncbi:peptidyl-tRNA hydrolase ICT1, mitochondrial [Momordica charantia]|uniref:Peptidyl-tRNA hydrolase ICT1, mitochondrial n=1 Tax=Momordica charantia TaxID=3673 RepID=A0A6J1DF18_MOMCH|nr:peptidyl-tRNA hydrolase ICT1, mitochondrial [Momordica charantia]
MAVIRTTTNIILREILHSHPWFPPSPSPIFPSTLHNPNNGALRFRLREISFGRVLCASSDSGAGKVSARLSQVQQLLQEAEERALSADREPAPKITLDHVTVNFARSGGPGGQNVNKVNTKVDMRFNVKDAYWLSDRIRERIMQMEKNRINKDGELVISSTKTRTQKGNIEDALEKLQAIIDAASYVPPPPSEEQKKKIAKMAAIGEQKRLKSKKILSDKKAFRRSRDSWD